MKDIVVDSYEMYFLAVVTELSARNIICFISVSSGLKHLVLCVLVIKHFRYSLGVLQPLHAAILRMYKFFYNLLHILLWEYENISSKLNLKNMIIITFKDKTKNSITN